MANETTVPENEACSLVLTLAYDGARFNGFAKQKDETLRCVQSEIEKALATYFRLPVQTVCAGRTDAGVHALGQVVSCVLPKSSIEGVDRSKLLISLNALTPEDISVKDARTEDEGFSARFDAKSREYRYRIVTGAVSPQFLRRFAWWHRSRLDLDAMRAGAAHLVGEHDFKSFCKAQSAVDKVTMRFVESIDIFTEEQMGEECVVIKVVGNAFLHSMVRTIVGTLVQVGRGNHEPEWVAEVLEAKDRTAAAETAPAHGLTFWHVTY